MSGSPAAFKDTKFFFDINSESFPFTGRPSISGRPSITGRESLQILKDFSFLSDNGSFSGRPSITGRESLQIIKDISLLSENALSLINNNSPKFLEKPSLTGRESLQILDLQNFCNLDVDLERKDLLGVETPDTLNNLRCDSVADSLSPFNNGFLKSASSYSFDFSDLSKFSDVSEIVKVSRIYSVGSDKLNTGFLGVSIPEYGDKAFERCNSVTVMEEREGKKVDDIGKRRCVSEVNCKKNLPSVSSTNLPGVEDENDDVFSDSIFIEAQHLASKMADGSILDESFDGSNILDSTPHPEWEGTEEVEPERPQCNTEDVFKTVDILLPVIKIVDTENPENESVVETNVEKSTESKVNDGTIDSNIPNASSINENPNVSDNSKQNISNENGNLSNNERRLNVSRASSTSTGSKSRDAKEILQNLSLLLSSENLNKEQKTTGQNLLCNLADILCIDDENTSGGKKQSTSSEESSSGEDPKRNSCFDVVPEDEKPVDLSMKGKQLSHSFSYPSRKVPEQKLSNNLKSQVESMRSIAKNISSSNGKMMGSLSKLKPRKMEENVKKGPLRAVIPLNVMAKSKEVESKPKSNLKKVEQTPPKSKLQESIPKYKKATSTPLQDIKLKPMAQSTPDNERRTLENNTSQIKRKFSCPVSPLARPNLKGKLGGSKVDLNKSDSMPDILNNNTSGVSVKADERKALNRRKSASDLKAQTSAKPPIKRSFSIGKENQLFPLKKSIDRSKPIMENDVEGNKKPIGSTKSLLRPFNLMSKLKPSKK